MVTSVCVLEVLCFVKTTLYYDSRIQKTNNKVKATWDVIKTATNNKTSNKTTRTSEIKK